MVLPGLPATASGSCQTLLDSGSFKKSLSSALANFCYLDQRFKAEGYALHTLSLKSFQMSYTHARKVLIIDHITHQLGLKLGSTMDANLQEASKTVWDVRISCQSVLDWAGEHPGTHDNYRKHIVTTRIVYDELQRRLHDDTLQLSPDRQLKEEAFAMDLAIMFAPCTLDRDENFTAQQLQVTTLHNSTLEHQLSEYSKSPAVVNAYQVYRNRPVLFINDESS